LLLPCWPEIPNKKVNVLPTKSTYELFYSIQNVYLLAVGIVYLLVDVIGMVRKNLIKLKFGQQGQNFKL
jgi:hypothetical protein